MSFDILPEEILILLFCHTADQNWLAFSEQPPYLVCKKWHKILTSKSFWCHFHRFWNSNLPYNRSKIDHIPWKLVASIMVNHKFNQNLLKNISGELTSSEEFHAQENRALDSEYLMSPWPNYPFWRIWSSAGQGWKVIKGNEFDEFSYWFFTSYHSCSKEQIVPLEILGLKLPLKNHTVVITVSQWFKFLGPCVLDLSLTLIGQNKDILSKTTDRRRYKDEVIGKWTEAKLSHTTNLSEVKFLKFYHGSTCDLVLEDEEEQKRVGTCLAESSLTISFPKFEILD